MSDDDEKDDLTLLHDLGEFEHLKDEDLDDKFSSFDENAEVSIDSLDEAEEQDFSSSQSSDFDEETIDLPQELIDESNDQESDQYELTDGQGNEDLETTQNEFDGQTTDLPSFEQDDENSFEEETTDIPSFDSNEENDSLNFEDVSNNDDSFLNSDFDEETSDLPDQTVNLTSNNNLEENSPNEDEDFSFSDQEDEDKDDNSDRTDSFESNEEDQENLPLETSTFAKEVKEEIEQLNYESIQTGAGGPNYSIIIKNIVYQEDGENILQTLEEFKVINDDNKRDYEVGLNNGAIIISSISEYLSTKIVHKLRNLNVDILLGFSDELMPSRSIVGKKSLGLINKDHLKQNKNEDIDLGIKELSPKDVITSTLPVLENHTVHSYLSIVSSELFLNESEISLATISESSTKEDGETKNINQQLDYYQKLTEQLKLKTFQLGGNAVVGVSFHLTPAPTTNISSSEKKFKFTAIGNAVKVVFHEGPRI